MKRADTPRTDAVAIEMGSQRIRYVRAEYMAELEREMTEDAERYRYLRECNGLGVYELGTYPAACYFGTALDEHIDAARAALKE